MSDFPVDPTTGRALLGGRARRAQRDWLDRLPAVRPPFDPHVVADAADRAFALGEPVEIGGLIVVPDVTVLAGIANGLELPRTWTLRRDDGRTAWLYRDPRVAS